MQAVRRAKGLSPFHLANTAILLIFSIVAFYPLWQEVSISFSSAAEAVRGGLFLFPRDMTWSAYHIVVSSNYIWTAYFNSAFITLVGTALSVFLTASTAYPLVKSGLPGKNFITFLILFTMLFSGGIIPTYLLVKSLGLINSLWALIIPGAISAYNVLVMRSFFANLPVELEESATIDGANPIRIFFTIIFPLSTPVLATIALWEAVGLWNNFLQALIYLNDRSKYTLPVLLKDIINGQQQLQQAGIFSDTSSDSVIAATIVMSILPMLCVYPFLQKYFTKGVMIGAIKS